jgi:hypothetical protein
VKLTWKHYTTPPMRAITGQLADGEHDRYLISQAWDGRVLLCRWGKTLDQVGIEAIRMAIATSMEVTGAEQGRELAETFESGEDLAWARAWHHMRPVADTRGGSAHLPHGGQP